MLRGLMHSSNRKLPRLAAAGLLIIATLTPPGTADAGGTDWLPKEWQIGAMVMTSPRYEGARDYRAIAIPLVAPVGASNGMVQVKGLDEIRLRLFSIDRLELGPLAGWRFGRDEDDGRRLAGLGDIDGGLVAGGYAAYRLLGPASAFLAYQHQLTGDDTGGLLRFGVESKAQVHPALTLTATVGSTWASEDYMRAFFGVTPPQAALSGLAAYAPAAGIKDVSLALGADIALDRRWTLRLTGRYTQLLGDAADSPIVERDGQLYGGIGLTYSLSRLR